MILEFFEFLLHLSTVAILEYICVKHNNTVIIFAEFFVTFLVAKFFIIWDMIGKKILFEFFVTFSVAKLKKIWD